MRIILDTNVIVSAIIQRSYPYFILDRVFVDANLELCISEELFVEYVEVLSREKFSRFPDFYSRAQIVLNDIVNIGKRFSPSYKVAMIKDEPDNRLLELADIARANYLVTGNTNDFTMDKFKETKIVTPKEFYEMINR